MLSYYDGSYANALVSLFPDVTLDKRKFTVLPRMFTLPSEPPPFQLLVVLTLLTLKDSSKNFGYHTLNFFIYQALIGVTATTGDNSLLNLHLQWDLIPLWRATGMQLQERNSFL